MFFSKFPFAKPFFTSGSFFKLTLQPKISRGNAKQRPLITTEIPKILGPYFNPCFVVGYIPSLRNWVYKPSLLLVKLDAKQRPSRNNWNHHLVSSWPGMMEIRKSRDISPSLYKFTIPYGKQRPSRNWFCTSLLWQTPQRPSPPLSASPSRRSSPWRGRSGEGDFWAPQKTRENNVGEKHDLQMYKGVKNPS